MTSVDVRCDGSTAVLRVGGIFTHESQGHLEELLGWLIGHGMTEVRVELGATIGIDWECLSLLRAARYRLRRRHGHLTVSSSWDGLARELMLAGLAGLAVSGAPSEGAAGMGNDPSAPVDNSWRADHPKTGMSVVDWQGRSLPAE